MPKIFKNCTGVRVKLLIALLPGNHSGLPGKIPKWKHPFVKSFMQVYLVLMAGLLTYQAKGQLSLAGQIRTRSELRDGVGSLNAQSNSAAFFTSQRTRLTFHYTASKLIFHTSLQDIRVWGQDASTISNADGNKLSVHEAWAEIILANKKDTAFKNVKGPLYFAIKIGRQELMYDDSRLLGNLDWLQQARRHDAIVLKLITKGWQVDFGNAFNQNTDAFNYNGTSYTPANVSPYIKDNKGNLAATPAGMIPFTNAAGWSTKTGAPSLLVMPSTNGLTQDYKAMQFLYAGRSFGSTKLAGLLLADHFGKYSIDSVKNIAGMDTGYIYGRRFNKKGVNTRVTGGILLSSILDKKRNWILTAGFYYQGGKDRDAQKTDAYTSTLSLSYQKTSLTYSAGWDYVSGNDAFSSSVVNHRFDPLYGTPHKFWGFMDYFYVGTGSPAGGLSNAFIKTKYTGKNKRLAATLDYHYFALANDQKDVTGRAINKYLGSEFDLVTWYSLNKFTVLEWGASVMAASKSMEYAKSITPGTAKLTAFWSYLSINITPAFLFK